jgi:hypothetical protein
MRKRQHGKPSGASQHLCGSVLMLYADEIQKKYSHSHLMHLVEHRVCDLDCCAEVYACTGSHQHENQKLAYRTVQHDCAQAIEVQVYVRKERVLVARHVPASSLLAFDGWHERIF